MENSIFKSIEKCLDEVNEVIFEYKYSNKSVSYFFDYGVRKTTILYLKLIKLQLEICISYIDLYLKNYEE